MKKMQKTLVATGLALTSTVLLSGCVMILPMHYPGPWMVHGPLQFPFPSSVPGPTHTDPPFDFEAEAAKTLAFAKTLVGMDEQAAVDSIITNGFTYRVVSRDGEDFVVTMDYRFDRINLTIVKSIVTDVSVG